MKLLETTKKLVLSLLRIAVVETGSNLFFVPVL